MGGGAAHGVLKCGVDAGLVAAEEDVLAIKPLEALLCGVLTRPLEARLLACMHARTQECMRRHAYGLWRVLCAACA